MPSVLIEIRKSYSKEEEIALIEAVHGSLVDTFKIKPTDKTVRLIVHEPHRFAHPPTLTESESFTHITIDVFTGRSIEAKRNLYQALVARLGVLGIPSDHIVILLRESPLENWGVRGGHAACEINLGFKVDI
jgi:phenylpyruvate tautomerase PptA (4-oxalocrotonate tautomerase family)